MLEARFREFRMQPAVELQAQRSAVRVLVLTGLGLNCEVETAEAFRLVGASPERVHLLDLLRDSEERSLSDYQIIVFVGGFAFGDHLGAGSVFANKIRSRLYDQLVRFIHSGGLALGDLQWLSNHGAPRHAAGIRRRLSHPPCDSGAQRQAGLLGYLGASEGRPRLSLRLDPRPGRDRPANSSWRGQVRDRERRDRRAPQTGAPGGGTLHRRRRQADTKLARQPERIRRRGSGYL